MKFDTIEFSNFKFVEDQLWMTPMSFQIINSKPQNWRASDQLKALDKIERLQCPSPCKLVQYEALKHFWIHQYEEYENLKKKHNASFMWKV